MKRGTTDLSLLVGVNKPSGMSSHDVVNACRRIFGERRVGHTGTLDPLAEGVLPIAIGPATRLDRYLTGHDKRYLAVLRFGSETTTDDCQGEVVATAPCPDDLLSGDFAEEYIRGLAGEHLQMPPQYSAIKVQGRKAYEIARAGEQAALEPRPITVHWAELAGRRFNEEEGCIEWAVLFYVSKGTYIRSLVRDIGRELGCYAHVGNLLRSASGPLTLDFCYSLETLEALGTQAALDPVRYLGFRFAYGDGFASLLLNGGKIPAQELELYHLRDELSPDGEAPCACCSTGTEPSDAPLEDGEPIALVFENKLKAIYRFDEATGSLKPETVFSIGVARR